MITLLIILIVVAMAITIVRRLPKSGCNQECNQGRSCNCGAKDGQ
jgi:hypothetical protein